MPQDSKKVEDTVRQKEIVKGDTELRKKYWRITSKEGKSLEFYPVFELSKETGDMEARYLEFKFLNADGTTESLHFNWLDIYMFVYFTCNEELRKNLALRYERNVNYIPYDITVQLTDEEKKTGIAKRRVELPVEELTMAIARNEAFKLVMKNKLKDPRSFQYKGKA